jgi:hypothetical protein
MANNTFFIVYQSFWDSPEVIVTTPEMEAETIRQFFTEADRDLEDYDRTEHCSPCIPVRVTQLHVL